MAPKKAKMSEEAEKVEKEKAEAKEEDEEEDESSSEEDEDEEDLDGSSSDDSDEEIIGEHAPNIHTYIPAYQRCILKHSNPVVSFLG
jgi:hypothetical protein